MTTGRPEAFGPLLRQFRRDALLTQRGLAERAGISPRTVRDLELDGARAPRAETVKLVADALGLEGERRDALFDASVRARRRPDDGHPPAGADAPPAGAALPPVAAELPAADGAPLLGREDALSTLLGLLAGPTGRIVTLVGPGGVGKTRLALEAARRLEAGGLPVAWAPLEALDAPEEVLPAIARAVGAAGQQGDPVTRIADAVGGRPLLLLLDNVEHVIDAAADVAAVLAASPTLRLLATSREALRIGDEARLPVAPLPVPAGSDDDAAATASPAVALFLDRAGLGGATVGTMAMTDVRRVVTALDGLPLAIELAAAQAQDLSVASVAALLDRTGIGALESGRRDVPERLRSMDRAIRWSHDLLEERPRRLLRTLSVFRGGCDADLLGEVCDRLGDPGLVRGLPALVRASLVADRQGPGGHGRISLLSPIQLFAAAELEAAGEAEAAALAHRQAMVAHARRAFARMVGPGALAGLADFDRERDNLTAALDRAIRAGNAADAMALAASMALWWETRGEVADGFRWLQRALAVPGADAHPEDVSRAGRIAIVLGVFLGHADHWLPLAGRLERVATEAGDDRGLAIALTWLGDHAWYVGGDLPAARDHHERAVALAEPLGDSIELAQACDRLGDVLTELGEPAAALRVLERGIAVRRRLGYELNLSVTLLLRACALDALGRDGEARAGFLEAATQAGRMGFPVVAAQALVRLAASDAAGPGRVADALRLLGAAEGALERHRVALDPTLAPFRDGALAAGAAALGEAERKRLLAEGRGLPLDEALEIAGRGA